MMNLSRAISNELRLFSVSASRELDQRTIHEFGIDGFTLMEIAARGASDLLKKELKRESRGLYICGKGNNAGDALAAARYLLTEENHTITVLMLFGDSNLSADADKNHRLLAELKARGEPVSFISKHDLPESFSGFDYIIDGIFGTGLTRKPDKAVRHLIESINRTNVPVYSMDIPSGMSGDSGLAEGGAIRAKATFAFGTNKIGFWLNDARAYTGDIHFIELPFPDHLKQADAVLVNDKLARILPETERKARHKYDGGVVHIIAGSGGLTGAGIMTAQSAWKQGAGSVFLYCPERLLPIYEMTLPQVIKIGIGDSDDTAFKPEHAPAISAQMKKKPGVLLAGPGTGTKTETGLCITEVLKHHNGYAVLDADALSFWDQLKNFPAEKRKKWLLTPHIGEAENYLGFTFSDEPGRIKETRQFSETHSCSLLLKGNPSLLSIPGQPLFLTGYDTAIFARAGFGDVLAGTITSKIGLNNSIELSVISALTDGYKRFLLLEPGIMFGPEHLT